MVSCCQGVFGPAKGIPEQAGAYRPRGDGPWFVRCVSEVAHPLPDTVERERKLAEKETVQREESKHHARRNGLNGCIRCSMGALESTRQGTAARDS